MLELIKKGKEWKIIYLSYICNIHFKVKFNYSFENCVHSIIFIYNKIHYIFCDHA